MHTDIEKNGASCPIHLENTCNTYSHRRRISWTAILVGALIAVGLGFLLNLFEMAIGVNLLSADKEGTITGLAIGGFLAIVVGVIASMFVAGYAAGYLGKLYVPARNLGILYGFLTWCLAIIITGALSMHMGEYANAGAQMLSKQHQTNRVNQPDNAAQANVNEAVNQANNNVQVLADKTNLEQKDILTISAYAIFVLFFIGALASCAGGCCGMACRRDECIDNVPHT